MTWRKNERIAFDIDISIDIFVSQTERQGKNSGAAHLLTLICLDDTIIW